MNDYTQEAVEAAAQALLDRVRQGMGRRPISLSEATGKDELLRRSEAALAAAEPYMRRKWTEELVERIESSNLGAPLRIYPDGTARIADGPEMRALLCEFILEEANS
ncbi:MAG: hypothetical protein LKJ18_01980 [Ancrocorticia sp.]|nr:hypothetical protein [Ancrocorticia sp.]MCI1962908.1 hypothetical protein [Ancrocorticia sp.]MCI2001812.1 hypothetical protein [Ancrocorticia sp.]MCI2001865.1 hypothetical protein [Ancrocorticia sp.]